MKSMPEFRMNVYGGCLNFGAKIKVRKERKLIWRAFVSIINHKPKKLFVCLFLWKKSKR